MSEEFDFVGPNDLPALLAISNPPALAAVKNTLAGMGYKVHVVETHLQFETRYNQINYQVVVVEDTFAGNPTEENPSLQFLQNLPMAQRRYTTSSCWAAPLKRSTPSRPSPRASIALSIIRKSP